MPLPAPVAGGARGTRGVGVMPFPHRERHPPALKAVPDEDDRGQGVVSAEDDVGCLAVLRKSDPGWKGMALQLDTGHFGRLAGIC